MKETYLPDCMMPDGAEPCLGYRDLLAERDALRATLWTVVRSVVAIGPRECIIPTEVIEQAKAQIK